MDSGQSNNSKRLPSGKTTDLADVYGNGYRQCVVWWGGVESNERALQRFDRANAADEQRRHATHWSYTATPCRSLGVERFSAKP